MTHASTKLAAVFYGYLLVALLLGFFAASTQLTAANTFSEVCPQADSRSSLYAMEEMGVQADCCAEDKADNCAQVCHIAVYSMTQQSPLALLKLLDENAISRVWRLSSLNPAPLIRPPLFV